MVKKKIPKILEKLVYDHLKKTIIEIQERSHEDNAKFKISRNNLGE